MGCVKGVVTNLVKIIEKGKDITLIGLNYSDRLFYLSNKIKNIHIGDIVSMTYKDAICPMVNTVRKVDSND